MGRKESNQTNQTKPYKTIPKNLLLPYPQSTSRMADHLLPSFRGVSMRLCIPTSDSTKTWNMSNLLASASTRLKKESIRVRYHETSLSPPVKLFLLTVPRRCFFCGSFLLFMFRVCHAVLSVHSSLMVTSWERAGLLGLLT